MNAEAFHAFNRAFSAAAALLYAALLTAFFHPFVTPQNRKWKKLLLIFSACLLFETVCGLASLPQGSLCLILTLLLTACAQYTGMEKSLVFLLMLLYFNARISSGLIAESLYFLMERAFPFQAEAPETLFLRAAILVTLFLFTHAALFFAMLHTLRHRIQKQPLTLHRREVYLLSFVPAAGLLFGWVISRLLFEIRDGMLLQLYERHPAFLAVVPLLALLFYAGAWLTIAFAQDMAALRAQQAAWFVERQQTQAIRARIQEAERLYTQIRSLKHEMRGHLNTIQALAGNGEYVSLTAYIARMEEGMHSLAPPVPTGNPVTDIIVGDTHRRCQELGIDFQITFHYPSGAYDAFDMGIILQNLLQNAVEASEKVEQGARRISLTGRENGRFFLMEIQNTFAGRVTFGPDGLPVTTKQENAPMHGIGLANVRREAEKYMGGLELKTERQIFFATVLLQEPGGV